MNEQTNINIKGTAKQHVTDDYAQRISIGMENTTKINTHMIASLVQNGNSK